MAKGKPPQGTIKFEVSRSGNRIKILYSDDGRGLNISKLVENSPELDSLSDEKKVAEAIFKSGVSTADEITDISGRGVGMDAVRKFIEIEEGSVEVKLLGEPENGFARFALEITLPYNQGSKDKFDMTKIHRKVLGTG